MTRPTVEPAVTSALHQPRTVTAGNAVRAPRVLRAAVVFAPTWTLTTPTAARAASFALQARVARGFACHSVKMPMRFRHDPHGWRVRTGDSDLTASRERDQSWTICLMNS